MKKFKDLVVSFISLGLAFLASLGIQSLLKTEALIPAIFALAVLLIALLTKGYLYGIFSALISVIAVNYAFTFPYFKLNFTIPENLISAIILIVITLITSTLTTKIRRWENLRAENEKEKMRANLLRAISHDLRTPLTTIYGSSSALLENSESFTVEQKNQMLKGIKEDASWLVRMVENLLSVTKIENGNVRIIKSPIVLDELIDSVLRKFKKQYPTQDIQLELPDDFTIIPMDAILIEQVIINILDNAVQHALGMTKLTLKVFTIDKKAIFEISDNGCGIAEDRLKGIFSGLYESKTSPDSKKRNAGIGLSVCSTIIKAHGGDITAENSKNGGAKFRFSLNTEEDSNEHK